MESITTTGSRLFMLSRRWPIWVVTCLGLLVSFTAQADIHFGIISTARMTSKTTASINVATDVAGAVTFTVFPAGLPEVSDLVGISLQGFATSASAADPRIQNLFVGAGATTAIVRAVFPPGGSTAVLEQSSPEGKVVLALLPIGAVRGTRFLVPIGDLQHGTSVIVGNPTDVETAIVVQYGNGAEQAPVPLRAFSTFVINVTTANTLMIITSANQNVFVIAQLVVNTGKTTVMTYLPSRSTQ